MRFGVREVRIPVLEDGKLAYHLPFEIVGPSSWRELHEVNYGINPENGSLLRRQTFPEAIRLVTFALNHRKDKRFEPVIEALHTYGVTADTLELWTRQGLYGVDHPKGLIEQLGKNDQKKLRRIQSELDTRLSGASGKKVITSEDGLVRFTHRDNITYNESRNVFGRNSGLIVHAGTGKDARDLAKASKAYRFKPAFYGFEKKDKLFVGVPDVYSCGFVGWLIVDGYGFHVDGVRCSFGVSETAEGGAPKNRRRNKK